MSNLSLISEIGNFFLPQVCIFCGNQGIQNGHIPICESCLEDFIPVLDPICPCCGEPFQGNTSSHLCGRCLHSPPPFEQARSLFLYKGKARELICELKFRNNLSTLSILDYLLKTWSKDLITELGCDLIVPVPLDRKGLKRRGYNQALLISICLANRIGKPVRRDHLRKVRATVPQIGLTRNQRWANIRGAFQVKDARGFRGKSILLVDDVYTTGATVRECSRELLGAGARSVKVWTLARTVFE